MTFIDSQGRKKNLKNANKYTIDWDAKSLSKFQKAAKDFLRPYWCRDHVFEEMPVVGSRSRFDFYNATKRVVLEVMGNQHKTFVPFFQKTRSTFLSQIKRDLDKQEFCDNNGITFMEIYEEDFYNKTTKELEKFFAENGVFL